MKTKEVVDELTVKRAIGAELLMRLRAQYDLNKIILAGIKTRGVCRSSYQRMLGALENTVPVELDTKPFRDDVKKRRRYFSDFC